MLAAGEIPDVELSWVLIWVVWGLQVLLEQGLLPFPGLEHHLAARRPIPWDWEIQAGITWMLHVPLRVCRCGRSGIRAAVPDGFLAA